MASKEALELAILEYEKETIDDENNQWVKNVLKGLKECRQNLDKLEKVKEILKKKYFHTLDITTDDYQNYWCMCNNESINPNEIATKEEYYFVQDYLSK